MQDEKPWNASTAREQAEEKQKEKREEERTGDSNFAKIYPQGWWRLKMLMDDNPPAAKLYMFLCEHMDGKGVLVATRETLADAMGVSVKSISRWANYLDKKHALTILRLGPGANAYCVNPEEVWKAFASAKPYAPFHTKTLVGKKENAGIKRRLTMMMGKPKRPDQPSLFKEDDDDWDALGDIAKEPSREAAE